MQKDGFLHGWRQRVQLRLGAELLLETLHEGLTGVFESGTKSCQFSVSETERNSDSIMETVKLTLWTCCLGSEEAAEKIHRVLTHRLTREETLKHF